ncbi:hypothetical protein DFP72DRAFT_1048233 [Ephemerocybe angulata]|uniref:Uncharacterized protein n=1 Tax=Ephemerocybe angulata TaxID=980116 RepID=A0A8H6HRS0_9AGAR|nr:hypothetical protein DFP72DRAFT_1048233 [Tulosesus angulatus]
MDSEMNERQIHSPLTETVLRGVVHLPEASPSNQIEIMIISSDVDVTSTNLKKRRKGASDLPFRGMISHVPDRVGWIHQGFTQDSPLAIMGAHWPGHTRQGKTIVHGRTKAAVACMERANDQLEDTELDRDLDEVETKAGTLHTSQNPEIRGERRKIVGTNERKKHGERTSQGSIERERKALPQRTKTPTKKKGATRGHIRHTHKPERRRIPPSATPACETPEVTTWGPSNLHATPTGRASQWTNRLSNTIRHKSRVHGTHSSSERGSRSIERDALRAEIRLQETTNGRTRERMASEGRRNEKKCRPNDLINEDLINERTHPYRNKTKQKGGMVRTPETHKPERRRILAVRTTSNRDSPDGRCAKLSLGAFPQEERRKDDIGRTQEGLVVQESLRGKAGLPHDEPTPPHPSIHPSRRPTLDHIVARPLPCGTLAVASYRRKANRGAIEGRVEEGGDSQDRSRTKEGRGVLETKLDGYHKPVSSVQRSYRRKMESEVVEGRAEDVESSTKTVNPRMEPERRRIACRILGVIRSRGVSANGAEHALWRELAGGWWWSRTRDGGSWKEGMEAAIDRLIDTHPHVSGRFHDRRVVSTHLPLFLTPPSLFPPDRPLWVDGRTTGWIEMENTQEAEWLDVSSGGRQSSVDTALRHLHPPLPRRHDIRLARHQPGHDAAQVRGGEPAETVRNVPLFVLTRKTPNDSVARHAATPGVSFAIGAVRRDPPPLGLVRLPGSFVAPFSFVGVVFLLCMGVEVLVMYSFARHFFFFLRSSGVRPFVRSFTPTTVPSPTARPVRQLHTTFGTGVAVCWMGRPSYILRPSCGEHAPRALRATR